jgi:hypothetical protein
MVATAFNEAAHPLSFLVSEEGHGFISRDTVTIGTNQTILAGTVLGRTDVIANTTASLTTDAGNTGNGVFTLDASTPVLASAVDGTYRVICVTAGTGGVFEVFSPAGVEIGRVTAGGSAFANQIKFAIATAGVAFAAGDAFSVIVGVELQGDVTYAALNPAATDGTQNAFAVAGYPVTTVSSTAQITAITRNAEVRLADLSWPSITAAQKAEAIEQLRQRAIVCR